MSLGDEHQQTYVFGAAAWLHRRYSSNWVTSKGLLCKLSGAKSLATGQLESTLTELLSYFLSTSNSTLIHSEVMQLAVSP